MTGYKPTRTHLGQLPFGADLYESLSKIAVDEDIKLGRISGLGATTHAVVAYYDQQTKKYNPLEFSGGMEILNLHGNISLRDGRPFVHAHVILGDAQGKTFGGHLLPGTKLFACEVFVEEYEGEQLSRAHEENTGLFLWTSAKLV